MRKYQAASQHWLLAFLEHISSLTSGHKILTNLVHDLLRLFKILNLMRRTTVACAFFTESTSSVRQALHSGEEASSIKLIRTSHCTWVSPLSTSWTIRARYNFPLRSIFRNLTSMTCILFRMRIQFWGRNLRTNTSLFIAIQFIEWFLLILGNHYQCLLDLLWHDIQTSIWPLHASSPKSTFNISIKIVWSQAE